MYSFQQIPVSTYVMEKDMKNCPIHAYLLTGKSIKNGINYKNAEFFA